MIKSSYAKDEKLLRDGRANAHELSRSLFLALCKHTTLSLVARTIASAFLNIDGKKRARRKRERVI